jgi:hypothetical protein
MVYFRRRFCSVMKMEITSHNPEHDSLNSTCDRALLIFYLFTAAYLKLAEIQ